MGPRQRTMDYYGADRKLSELGEQDLDDFLDQDMFTPPTSDVDIEHYGLDNTPIDQMDSEWLDNFFHDPVLNDRMMTDALQPQHVQSEHSYSLTNGEKITLNGQIKVEPTDKGSELDDFLTNTINPDMTFTPVAMNTSASQQCIVQTSAMAENVYPKMEMKSDLLATDAEVAMAVSSIETSSAPVAMVTRTSMHPQTLLKQPTIILATTQQSSSVASSSSSMQFSSTSSLVNSIKQEHVVLPGVNIKVEPSDTASNVSSPEHSTMYDSIGLPPTPPSSSNSDSDGSLSPQQSAPPSPIRHGHQFLRQHVHTQHTLGGASAALSQPLFTSPIPTSGVLILSDEEKRTLIAEGYPIPSKLPLTKQEEKNLKKIRRKIKNKISAQESRRKKKEYLETLEKKVEAYNSENSDLKKKVEQLEKNNRSLLGQLQKLQALVSKVPRPSSPTTQTGTCLMVLVLFFAVFVGTWSPLTWSVGYSSSSVAAGQPSQSPSPLNLPAEQVMGPDIQKPMSDPYSTPNMRSRVLLSTKDDQEEPYGPHIPFSYHDFFMHWFSEDMVSCHSDNMEVVSSDVDFAVSAPMPQVIAEVELKAKTVWLPNHMSPNITAQVMTQQVNTTA